MTFKSILKIAAVALLLGAPGTAHGRNLLHYSWSTNGEAKDKLFPETNGKIIFVNTIETECPPAELIKSAENYLMGLKISKNYEFNNLTSTSSKLVCEAEFPFGKQAWGIEFWGRPLFMLDKDATVVKFKVIIEAIVGKYRYILSDFETNRNTIRGEAKNDGQSNTIHFQRVNSLKKERDKEAADISKERDRLEKLYDYNTQIDYENYLYANEFYMVDRFVNGLDNLKCGGDGFSDDLDDIFGNNEVQSGSAGENALSIQNFTVGASGMYTMDINTATEKEFKESDAKVEPADKFFILGKGNSVYVTSGENDYELAAAQELRKQIKIDNFWNLVNSPEKADFIINYTVNLDGRDKAIMTVSATSRPIAKVRYTASSSESVRENREVARDLYLKNLYKAQQKTLHGETVSKLRDFYNY